MEEESLSSKVSLGAGTSRSLQYGTVLLEVYFICTYSIVLHSTRTVKCKSLSSPPPQYSTRRSQLPSPKRHGRLLGRREPELAVGEVRYGTDLHITLVRTYSTSVRVYQYSGFTVAARGGSATRPSLFGVCARARARARTRYQEIGEERAGAFFRFSFEKYILWW